MARTFILPLVLTALLSTAYAQTTSVNSEKANNTAACGSTNLPSYCFQSFPPTKKADGTTVSSPPPADGWHNNRPTTEPGFPLITSLYNPAPKNISKDANWGNVKSLTTLTNKPVFVSMQAWFCDANTQLEQAPLGRDGVNYPVCDSHLKVGHSSDDINYASTVVDDLWNRGIDGVLGTWEGNPSGCGWDGRNSFSTNFTHNTCSAVTGRIDRTYLNIISKMQSQHSSMKYIMLYDESGFKWGPNCAAVLGGVDGPSCVQQKIKKDLVYARTNYFNQAQYLKSGTKYVVGVFIGMTSYFGQCTTGNLCNLESGQTCSSSSDCWGKIWDNVYNYLQTFTDPQNSANSLQVGFLFRKLTGWTEHQSIGTFFWVNPRDLDLPTATDYYDKQRDWRECNTWNDSIDPDNCSPKNLDTWYSQAGGTYASMLAFAPAYKGFDDRNASWNNNRIMSQRCGRTWVDSWEYMNGRSGIDYILITGWDDYEEGHAIELGIQNCVDENNFTITRSGNTLSWTTRFTDSTYGDRRTIAAYKLFDGNSSGTTLNSIDQFGIDAGACPSTSGSTPIQCSKDLQGYIWTKGTHYLFVKAIGKPSMENHMFTNSVSYTTSPVASVPSSIPDFGNVTVGQSSSQTITITNTGTAVLTVSNITAPVGFSITSNCVNVPIANNGGTCSETLTFSPTECRAYSGSLTFTDDSGDSGSGATDPTQTASVSGTGIASGGSCSPTPGSPTADLTAQTLDFGPQAVGTTVTKTLTLTNNGSATLNITSITFAGVSDYSRSGGTCATSLAAGSSCTIIVAFAPTAQGTRNGTIAVNGNASGTANLTGVGGDVIFANIDETPAASWTTQTGGAGTATGSLTVGIDSPSLDGSDGPGGKGSAQFQIGGSTPYSNFRWITTLNNNSSLAKYTLDAYVNLPNPTVPQGFYLGISQAVSNKYYPFKIQCDLRNDGTWKLWDGAGMTWFNTGVACTANMFPANSWVHLSFDFERTAGNQLHYQSITVGATKTVIDRYFNPATFSPDTIQAVFEEFGNSTQSTYSIYVDKWNVTASANPVPGPNLTVNPPSLAFGNQAVSTTSAQRTLTVTNTSASQQSITSVTSSSSVFGKTDNCAGATLQPGSSCTINLTFSPTSNGTATSTISITGTSSATAAVSGIGGSITYANIDQLTGWSQSADTGATGSVTVGVSNPSRDGSSAQFQIGGSGPSYKNVRWEKALSTNSSISNFTIDGYAYIADPSIPQAFQIGFSQAVSNSYYAFKTLCDFKAGGVWRVWDAANQTWYGTTATCTASMFPANTWVHVIVDVARVGGQLQYKSVTVNEVKTVLSTPNFNPATYSPDAAFATFGLNGNSNQSTYSIWIDNWNVTGW